MSKKLNEVKRKIREFVILSGREIINEINQRDQWILQVKHGEYVVGIVHPKKPPHNNYMVVTVSVNFDEKMLEIIRDLCRDPVGRSRFEFNLVQPLTSPHTAFRFFYNQDSDVGELRQYEITRRIFPFNEDFSVDDFDMAIQEVINLLVLSIQYFRTLFISVSSELGEAPPPPSSMYT